MPRLKQTAARLVSELQGNLALSDVDARRAAFVPLALKAGWSKARIARYLGVSRARIGQKVRKYEEYARRSEANTYPTLQQVLSDLPDAVDEETVPVKFKPADWNDEQFAIELLNRVA